MLAASVLLGRAASWGACFRRDVADPNLVATRKFATKLYRDEAIPNSI